jgi:hypothetical protein
VANERVPKEILEAQEHFTARMREMPRADEVVEYSQRFIVFLDILGFRNILEQSAKESPNTLFHDIVDSQWFHAATTSVDIEIISDSIIITSKDDHPASFIRVAFAANSLRDSFLERGILLRGGIAFGNHFHAHGIRISPVLVEAYEAETKIAIFPRIICAASALDRFAPALTQNGKGRSGIPKPPHFHVIRDEAPQIDFDGQHVLPFLPDTLEVYFLRTGHHHDPSYASTAEQVTHFTTVRPQRLDRWRKGIEIARSRCGDDRQKEKLNYIIGKWNEYMNSFNNFSADKIKSFLVKPL